MPEIKLPASYKVVILECERGWGSKIDDVKYFSDEQEAKAFVQSLAATITTSCVIHTNTLQSTALSFSATTNGLSRPRILKTRLPSFVLALAQSLKTSKCCLLGDPHRPRCTIYARKGQQVA